MSATEVKRRPAKAKATARQPRAKPPAKRLLETRLTAKVVATVVEALEQGAPLAGAAAVAGVPRRSFFDWLGRGRAGTGSKLEAELAEAVQMALDRCQADGARSLWLADDLRHRAWVLERRFPEVFGQRRVVEVGNADGRPFVLGITEESLEGVPVAKLEALRDALRALRDEVIDGEAVEVDEAELAELEPPQDEAA